MKVGIYVRLSKEDAKKNNSYDESESIQNQKSILIKYATEQNWEIYNIYSDEDYAGTDLTRPAWNKLLNDAQLKKIDIVLCKTQSRFSRDMEIVEKYIHGKFIEWGVRFVSIVDNADTQITGNKKSRQINGLVNDWFLEDLSDNIKKTLHNKHLEGKHTGSTVLYGYKKSEQNKGFLEFDEQASDIVRKIFNYYLNGNGIEKIANILNDSGVLNPTAYKKSQGINYKNPSCSATSILWSKKTVSGILKNIKYLGHAVAEQRGTISYKNAKIQDKPQQNWVIVENVNPAIIDADTFYKVQQMLGNHNRASNSGTRHIFSGKIYCAKCGSIMESHGGNGKKRLRCKMKALNKDGCTGASIYIEELKNEVLNHLNNLLSSYKNDIELESYLNISNQVEINKEKIIQQLTKNQGEIDKLNHIIIRLYSDRVEGTITDEQFLILMEEFNSKISSKKQALENEKSHLQEELSDCSQKQELQFTKNQIIEKYNNIKFLTYPIVNELIDKIEIKTYGEGRCKNKDITISWNI